MHTHPGIFFISGQKGTTPSQPHSTLHTYRVPFRITVHRHPRTALDLTRALNSPCMTYHYYRIISDTDTISIFFLYPCIFMPIYEHVYLT